MSDSSTSSSTIGDMIAPRQEASDDVTVKEKASRLWDSVRASVSNTSRDIKTTLHKPSDDIEIYSKPICLAGRSCQKADDREHMRTWKHLCPYQHQCHSQMYSHHLNDFVHSSILAEGAMLVDENDNKTKQRSSSNNKKKSTNDNNNNSLDFLDEATSNNTNQNDNFGFFGNNNNKNSSDENNDTAAISLLDSYRRNAPVQRMVAIRCYYGPAEWNIWYYAQTAQWPLPGEELSEEDRVILNFPDKDADDQESTTKKSATDKAKDFFDDLFSTVKEKIGKKDSSTSDEKDQQQQQPEGAQRLPTEENEGSSLLSGREEDE